jgi:hypothetical protein
MLDMIIKRPSSTILFLFLTTGLLFLPIRNNSIICAAASATGNLNTESPSTLVELTDFQAIPGNNQVTLIWETASEIDNAGFNLYRAETEDGEYAKINESLIPSEGSATQGAMYEFIDIEVLNGHTYYYKLESIDFSGMMEWYGPEVATLSASTTTTVPVSTSTTTTIITTTSIINSSTTSFASTSTITIAPTSTTTTALLSTTTTEPTTTTTIRSGPCAVEVIYGENSGATELLKEYRDNVLSKTPEGRDIIETYYKFSPMVTKLLEQMPLLKYRAKTLIDGMLPGIRNKVAESNKEP